MLRTSDPYLAFARAVGLFAPAWRPTSGIHPMAAVASDAHIGGNVSIGAFVSIGEGVEIGDNTVIFPNVTVGPGARIGADCVIHSNVAIRERVTVGHRVVLQNGVVIGSDGYGFVRRGDGTHEKIPQIATVVIEDDVELGANTTVDRPAVGETRIGSGTKIDNLVQIGHGVTVGRNVLMAAQVGIAGSTDVADEVIFGGQVGVGGHLTIGRGAVAVGQSGVTNSFDPGAMVAGYPAIDSARMAEGVGRLQAPSRTQAAYRGARGAPGRTGAAGNRSSASSWRSRSLACASPAVAQTAQTAHPAPSAQVDYLTRFAFHVSMEHLFSEEKRFVWDANWGGELDIVDYGRGRFTFVADYQTILGSELRAFDPNQGNYTLEGALSARTREVEFAGVFHHVSRHLSDRPKRFPVDWNMIGGRVGGGTTRGRVELQGRADIRGVIEKALVDYRWELDDGCARSHEHQATCLGRGDRAGCVCSESTARETAAPSSGSAAREACGSKDAAPPWSCSWPPNGGSTPTSSSFPPSTGSPPASGFRADDEGPANTGPTCHNRDSMRSSSRVALLVLTVAIAAVALTPVQAAVRPPKLQYQITTLPNGLRVILSEDHSTPIVHVSVWYHVGSKNERAGRTGFAHLFEHMMFKGSKNLEPEAHTSLISSVGGRANAYTTEDKPSSGRRCPRTTCRWRCGWKPIAWRRCAWTMTRSSASGRS